VPIDQVSTALRTESSNSVDQLRLPSQLALQEITVGNVVDLIEPDGNGTKALPMTLVPETQSTSQGNQLRILLPIESIEVNILSDRPQKLEAILPIKLDQQPPAQSITAIDDGKQESEGPGRTVLLPVTISVREQDTGKLASLLEQISGLIDRRSMKPTPQPGIDMTVTERAPATSIQHKIDSLPLQFASDKVEVFARSLNLESMSLQVQFDPEKVVRWLESLNQASRQRETNIVNPQMTRNDSGIVSGIQASQQDQSSSTGDNRYGFINPGATTSHLATASHTTQERSLFEEVMPARTQTLETSIPVSTAATEDSGQTGKLDLPNRMPELRPTIFQPPEDTKMSVDFDRMQIESLLKRGEIKLQLRPPELGNMRIELHTRDEQMVARLEVQSEAAKRVVEHNLPQLSDA
jgi:hypothetical protein